MGCGNSKFMPSLIKDGKKKKAAEACKKFEESKEEFGKEFEENKTKLQSKVLEIYNASSAQIKIVVKERTEAVLKKNSVEVTKFLEELAKIEFPGANQASEAATQFGPTLVSGPVFFIFEKLSRLVVPLEPESIIKENEVVIEEGKEKEEVEVVEKKKEEEIATLPKF